MHHTPDREPVFNEFQRINGNSNGIELPIEGTVFDTVYSEVSRLVVGTARIATKDSEGSFELPEQKVSLIERLKGVCEGIKETVLVDFRPAGMIKVEPGGNIELHMQSY
ncbi:MAG: hypothetical protein Q7K55_07850 [Candidatus Levybacteria bacterium]|nr:hypothetical protein [Candidatus Levybacteria bacterium]